MSRAVVIALCVLAVWMSGGGAARAQGASQVSVQDGMLVIESHTNTYALLVHPLALSEEPGSLSAEIHIRVEGAVGASWAPGVYLYWDTDKWIAIRSTSGLFRMEGYVEGTWVREQDFSVRPRTGEWTGLRLVWEGERVDVYASEDLKTWHLLTAVDRPGRGLPWLMIGKGYSASGPGALPFLANPYSDLGGWGVTQIDRVEVTVDGEPFFADDFSAGLDETRWTALLYGDGELKEKIDRLNALWQEHLLRQAGPNGAAMAEPEALSVPFSLSRWEAWRSAVKRPASLYKEELLENARRNFAQNPLARQALSSLMTQVSLVMEYSEEEIAHMIPETTPTSINWTPSPVSDRGFPHGDWDWSPYMPDVIIDRATGMQFPNDQYPEDIVVIATSGGVEQRLTFHRSKDWQFNGFPLATSFTGHIRARKVNYMATQAQNLALLYALTGDVRYARQAKAILMRFAQVYPNYLVHSGYHEFADIDALTAANQIGALPVDELTVPPNRPNRQLHAGYWMAGRATGSGMEGTFLLPVTVAYDLVADAVDANGEPLFTDEEQKRVERDLLLEGTKLLLADNAINNKTISARTAVAAIGAVVGDPLLVRWGLDGFERTLTEWFLPDGSTSESPAYGLMVLNSLWQLGEILHGYSDPPGFRDAAGDRIDSLDIYRNVRYQAVWQNMYASLLPNLRYPPIADSYTTSTLSEIMVLLMALRFDDVPEFTSLLRHRMGDLFLLLLYRDPAMDLSQAPSLRFPDVLFPAWRLGYLRAGANGEEATVILNVSDWGVHHHHDSLDLFYWKGGEELLSDLGYLWDDPQAHMTRRSVAHNLVVVNEQDQRTRGRGGSIHLFHPFGRFKVMEGSSSAYALTSLYRRFVAQIEHPGENSYVVDVFRVAGGELHDLVFHGPGSRFEPEGIRFEPSSTTLARYQFQNVREGAADAWRLRWRLGSGWLQTLAIAADGESVLLADGWGKRATKDPYSTLPYVLRRRRAQSAADGPLQSRYLSLYEGYRSAPLVESARALKLAGGPGEGAEETVGIEVLAGRYTDYVLSAVNPVAVSGSTANGELHFQGLAGAASFRDGKLEFMGVVGGRSLQIGAYGLTILAETDALSGEIASSDVTGFTVRGDELPTSFLTGWEIFVSEGRTQTAYPVRRVEVRGDEVFIATQDRQGGFPFAGGSQWSVPHAAYVERQKDESLLVWGTAPLKLRVPASHVVLERLAWNDAVPEGTGAIDGWRTAQYTLAGDVVEIVLAPHAADGGRIRVRLR